MTLEQKLRELHATVPINPHHDDVAKALRAAVRLALDEALKIAAGQEGFSLNGLVKIEWIVDPIRSLAAGLDHG